MTNLKVRKHRQIRNRQFIAITGISGSNNNFLQKIFLQKSPTKSLSKMA